MPIIYTYPSATPTANDLLVFSDVSATDPAKDTRKCTIADIVTLVGSLVPGGGTVTSVGLDFQATGLTTSGGASQTITTAGVFTVAGELVVANGGTGVNTLTSNGVLVGNGVSPITSSSNLSFDDTDLTLAGAGKMEFRDANSYIHSNAPNDLEIRATDIRLNAATLIDLNSDAVSFGEGGDTDIVLTFNGNTSTGVLTWMEDEDHFLVGDDIVIAEKLYIDDEGGEYISGNGTTATLTGAWASSNMTITGGSVTNITDLLVADGGTGESAFTDGGILLGSGTSPITATAQPTNGQILIGRTGLDPVLSTLTQGSNITITNSAGGIEIAYAGGGGDGIYGGSGALSGNTTITSGANDLTFTATTGDIIFNNSITPNPSMIIDGATNSVGIGGSFITTDQLSVFNSTSTNTTAIGIHATNTSGTQKGMDIEISGGATTNTALKLVAEGAGTNYNLVTFGPGNSGFGTITPAASAKVEVNSTTQGFLPPVMTTAQKNAISAPAEGLIVYDTDLHKLCVRVAAAWETITSA